MHLQREVQFAQSENDIRTVGGIDAFQHDALVDTFLHIIYDVNGEYKVVFDNFGEEVEVVLSSQN